MATFKACVQKNARTDFIRFISELPTIGDTIHEDRQDGHEERTFQSERNRRPLRASVLCRADSGI